MARSTKRVSRVVVTGPLAPFADAYRNELKARGYTPLTAVNQQRLVGRLSRWLKASGLNVSELSIERVEEFRTAELTSGRHRSSLSRPGLRCLVEVLEGLGVLAAEEPPKGSSNEQLLTAFERHLLVERSLATGTARGYVNHARRFLDGLSSDQELADLQASQVTAAVLARSAAVSVSTTQNFVAGLRSFLRFCFLEGLVELDLSQAALPVTGRRRSSLPQGITAADARALLGSCDRRSGIGRRDYAVVITLLRLGVRAGEVAGLRLDDIDWGAGELVVRGKGGRQDRLPLPGDVGGALAAYLRAGRPTSDRREVFLRARAPFTPIDPATVRSTLRRACRRAGLAEIGTHRLRHNLACEMVAAGVGLTHIAQVLRHSSLQSTAIYARVDLEQLRTVAAPWPFALPEGAKR